LACAKDTPSKYFSHRVVGRLNVLDQHMVDAPSIIHSFITFNSGSRAHKQQEKVIT